MKYIKEIIVSLILIPVVFSYAILFIFFKFMDLNDKVWGEK